MLLPYSRTLPTYMAPTIVYSQPKWHARMPGSGHVVTVSGSSRVDAKFAGAKALGCHVQIVIVEIAHDPETLRLNRRA